jgi:hypothetical protein
VPIGVNDPHLGKDTAREVTTDSLLELRLDALSSPALRPLRAALVDELVALTADRPGCLRALGLSPSQDHEIDRDGNELTVIVPA